MVSIRLGTCFRTGGFVPETGYVPGRVSARSVHLSLPGRILLSVCSAGLTFYGGLRRRRLFVRLGLERRAQALVLPFEEAQEAHCHLRGPAIGSFSGAWLFPDCQLRFLSFVPCFFFTVSFYFILLSPLFVLLPLVVACSSGGASVMSQSVKVKFAGWTSVRTGNTRESGRSSMTTKRMAGHASTRLTLRSEKRELHRNRGGCRGGCERGGQTRRRRRDI